MANLDVKLHAKQWEIYQDPHRFKIVCAGRRFGKTAVSAIIMLTVGLSKPNGVGWAVAPNYAQTMIFWRKLKDLLPPEYTKQIKEGDKCIILKNGFSIWMKSGDSPDNLRGEGLDFVVLDEFATMKEDVWTHAIRPALGDKQGKALFIGTPSGKNHFYRLALRGMSNEFPEYTYFHGTSFDNTFIKSEEFKDMAEDMPQLVYNQEILAEFIEGGGEVFSCVDRQMIPPSEILEDFQPEVVYVGGLDLAKHQDFSVLRIARLDTGRVVYTDRFNQIDWSYQIRRIKSNLLKYGNPTCYVDSTGVGDPIYEKLRKNSLNVKPVIISSKSKPQLIENLCLLLEDGKYWIPEDPQTLEEYSAYTYKIGETGYIRYSAPSGYHDDIVMADSLCAWGMKSNSTTIGIIHNPDTTSVSIYDEDRVVDYDNIPNAIGWDD